ncbi:alpha-N-acetyl-neuraminyl-2,3-beta-galactosyl-1,3-N-acetyl-galactosaminide alpha-2,6-sialyltransferase [Lepisosteus oculatus]|uniref:alpha-N-acetyl-neuraminyl-2,3-beta-galactosyl-1, 3-N-acetyl-galactosaminide alpha-2,6-sialyltransferase n=1 Tax=Lepisosteus oculatus TaxID=7918 RepID=UPI00371691A7
MKTLKLLWVGVGVTTAFAVLVCYNHVTKHIQAPAVSDIGLHGYVSISTGQYLDIHCKRCALVSSSGRMQNSGHGGDIDRADCVIRMNNAPTLGYEADVGHKTTLRVVSHTSVPLLLKNDTYYFGRSADTVYVFWGPEGNMRMDGKGRIFNALFRVAKKYPQAKVYTVTRERVLYCDSVFQNETGKNRMKSGAFLSTGFFTMVLAMDICDSIQVYGMISDNYCSQTNHTAVPYHYYERGKMDECHMYKAHERAPRGGHRFITEKAIFAKWATRKKIEFLHPSWTDEKIVS